MASSKKGKHRKIERESRSLRSSTKRKLTDSKMSSIKFKCHICRQKREQPKLVLCVNFEMCHHAFCQGCIERHFRNEAKKDHLRTSTVNWVCFVCRGLCHCEKCHLSLVKELSLLNDDLRENEAPNPSPKNNKGNIVSPM